MTCLDCFTRKAFTSYLDGKKPSTNTTMAKFVINCPETVYRTLYFYNNEPSKNKHFLILLSSLARNSQEPKLKRIFEIPWVLFEKSLSLYFDWPKSWFDGPWKKLWIFFVNGTFIMPQKKSFGKKLFWISCMGSKVPFWQNGKNCQNGTFEPVHEIQNFLAKILLLRHYESPIYKKYS